MEFTIEEKVAVIKQYIADEQENIEKNRHYIKGLEVRRNMASATDDTADLDFLSIAIQSGKDEIKESYWRIKKLQKALSMLGVAN